ncbi:MAG: FAD-binding protein [Acidimicrobiales bacterium]
MDDRVDDRVDDRNGGSDHDGDGLVVVGMGAAGLSAAVSYLEASDSHVPRHVTVLERSSPEARGGSTRYTSSWFRVTEERRLDPDFVTDMETYSQGMADLDYCRTLALEVPDSIAFLEQHGVEYTYFEQGFPNGNSGGGLGMPVRSGLGIVDGLAAVLEGSDRAHLVYETEAVRLSLGDDGCVDGVVVRGPDGSLRTCHASAVVIASGGFEGNGRMLTQYLGARACDIPVISPGTANNCGEGILMAIDVGAGTAGQFDMAHIEPVDPRAKKPDAVIYPYTYGIVVNRDAERFFDEGKDSFDETFEELGYEIWRNQHQTAFLVADQTSLSVNGFREVVFTDQPPVAADTLSDLARQLGLDPAALCETVAQYNAAIAPGEFDPYRFDGKHTENLDPPKSNWAFPLDSPPFVAYPMTGSICFTFGGLRTDTAGRVLTPSGRPIPALYAAGEVTGVYYHKYPVGTSVIRGVTFGRLAGAHAASATSQTSQMHPGGARPG